MSAEEIVLIDLTGDITENRLPSSISLNDFEDEDNYSSDSLASTVLNEAINLSSVDSENESDIEVDSFHEADEELCSICLRKGINCQTSCGHEFHERCISKWISYNKSCPNCRKSFE